MALAEEQLLVLLGWRLFAGSEEVGDVLHLYERHGRLFEPHGSGYGEIDESVMVSWTGPAAWSPAEYHCTCIIRSRP